MRDRRVVGLVTTYAEAIGRVATHGVSMELVDARACGAGLPLRRVPTPWPCPNAACEERTRGVAAQARSSGIAAFAFGDL
jgi:hypothetical protein